MLEIRHLTKRYKGVAAVENVSFTIRPGEILGYIGPNGAGKSTTVKMIIGLLDPSEGQILFHGRSVIEVLPDFQRRLGYVPEEPNLYPYMSGWEYLQLTGRRTLGTEVGFNPTNLYLLSLDPVRDGYSAEQSTAFFRKLLDGVKRQPSISAVSLTDTAPASPPPSVTFSAADAVGAADKYVVGKDYFETLGIPILRGRGFRKEDETNEATAVIVSERVVHDFWNGENPLGRRIEINHKVFEAVGVARNTKLYFTTEQPRPAIYFPLRPSLAGATLMARVAPGVDAVRMLRQEISAIDANVTPFDAFGMPEQITRQMFVFRFGVWIHGFEGLFGLILASIGLAGMTAYSVAQRGREIGIRIALGAQRADILSLVMKESAVLVAVGSILGLAGAWAGTRLLSGLISAIGRSAAFEPALLMGAPLLLAALALVACYLPARKSLRIDPVVALRQEWKS